MNASLPPDDDSTSRDDTDCKKASDEGADDAVRPVIDGRIDDYINDDDRRQYEWKSHYPPEVVRRIRWEAAYVSLVFISALLGILFTWRGDVLRLLVLDCAKCDHIAGVNRYAYVFFSGLLGGSLFSLKYLYKVAAHGWWHQDRGLWRALSPWLSAGLAFAVGALSAAGLFGFDVDKNHGAASFVSLGFIVGYFADGASRKMQEVADVMFGHPKAKHDKANKS